MKTDIDMFIPIEGTEYLTYNPEYKQNIDSKRMELLMKKAGIPHYYWNIEFSDYKGEKSKETIKKLKYYSENCFTEKFDYVHLYLCGKTSSQKTAVSVNILKEAIKQNKSVKFILAGSLINKLLKVQGFSVDVEIQNEINQLKKCDMILIDDIFDQNKSILWKNPESVTLILSAWDLFLREVLSSPTKIIFTSNIPLESIEEKFGTYIYELIDRNCIYLTLYDSIKEYKKENFNNLFEEI